MIARDQPTTLNVNVPSLPPAQVHGVRWATIDEFAHDSVASQGRDGTVLDLDVHDRRSGTGPDIDPGEVVPLGRGEGHR